MRRNWANPKVKAKIIQGMTDRWQDEGRRQRASDHMRIQNTDPNFRDEAARRAGFNRYWQQPEALDRQREVCRRLWSNPEFREDQKRKMSAQAKKLWQDPVHQERMRKHMFRWTRPEKIVRRWLKQLGLYYTVGGGFKAHHWHYGINVDFSDSRLKIALHVDGDFWHNPERFPERAQRDKDSDKKLRRLGWRVVRLWESDIHHKPKTCKSRILRVVARGSS
mgnify:CR=1 FL=1